jgi:hypothetical protein
VWPLAIGNALHVTPAQFEMYRTRAAAAGLALELQRCAESQREEEESRSSVVRRALIAAMKQQEQAAEAEVAE